MTQDNTKTSLTLGEAIKSSPVHRMDYYPFYSLLDVIPKLRFSRLELFTTRDMETSPEGDDATQDTMRRYCLRLEYNFDQPRR